MSKYHPDRMGSSGEEENQLEDIKGYLPYIVVIVALVAIVAFFLSRGEPKVKNSKIAIFETNLGSFEVELDTDNAPVTAGNFIDLAESGFYDGLTFHRVAEDFVIQGGDPEGDGTGGTETIPWENTTLKNKKYTIAMARKGNDPNSASCQFFINLKDNENLDNYDPPFVVFGKVIDGFDVVDEISSLVPASAERYDGPPTEDVTMNVSITER